MKDTKAIDAAIDALAKRFGGKNLYKMTDAQVGVKTVSSGRIDLDEALGGGYPVGKIIELYSEEACGKTGLALTFAASIQESGGLVGFIDAEHALNMEYAKGIGVDVDSLYICQPTTGEEAFETIRAMIGTKQFDLIVIDSVSALIPAAELAGESGETKMGLQARMMSQGMRLVTGATSEAECALMFINQLRDKIGTYVPTKSTSGGNALKFFASIRIEIKNKGKIKDGDDVIGFSQQITVVKNKIAPPYKVITADIIYGKGIDHNGVLIDTAISMGIIVRAGAYYKFDGVNISRGMANLRQMMDDNIEMRDAISDAITSSK